MPSLLISPAVLMKVYSVSTTNTKNSQWPTLLTDTFHPEPQLYHWNMKEAISNEKSQ